MDQREFLDSGESREAEGAARQTVNTRDEAMTINLQKPDITELKPKITVFGVGGGGGNAVNNMITGGLQGVEFVVANTDAQALTMNKAERIIQLGMGVTEGLGAGSMPDIGRAAAEECIDEINDHLNGTHMCFVTAGMGGGTGTGAAPVVARAAGERGILTVGVVTKPFDFEGARRMRTANMGIEELQASVDTLIVIPNQNLFRIANDKTTFADAFGMADQVLYSGVACITDLMVKEGLINLDFADVRSVMRDMGKAMMGTGEASGEARAMTAAEAAIANPLLDETSMKGAKGLLISITGGRDMTLFEVDEAATRIREEVDQDANIILGATFDENLEGLIRVSVVATGIESAAQMADREANRPVTRAVTGTSFAAKPAASVAPPVTAAAKPAPSTEEVMAQTEADMAAFEAPASRPAAPQPAPSMATPSLATATAPAPQGAPSQHEFAPQSRIFREPPQGEAMAAQPRTAPIASAPTPAPAAEHGIDDVTAELRAAPRMPQVEDFPPVFQAEMEARKAPQQSASDHDERGALGLLRRITKGLGGHHEEAETPRLRPAQHADVSMEPSPAQPRRPMSRDAELYAPRRGQLDDQGRQITQANAAEDDQLEIPAFLRRQAN